MSKVYDPILCMIVDKSTKDASPAGYSLFVDNKVVKVFWSFGAPVKEAQKWMKENMPGKVGTLTGNRSGAKYSITANDSSTVDRAIRAIDENTVWLVLGEDDITGKIKSYTTRGVSKEQAKREAEKHGLSNVEVRKY